MKKTFPHIYGPSEVGHGEAQCVFCLGTNRENAILDPNHCEKYQEYYLYTVERSRPRVEQFLIEKYGTVTWTAEQVTDGAQLMAVTMMAAWCAERAFDPEPTA
jgi:hypothetical protein